MVTRVNSAQIKDNGILREDMNTTHPLQAVVTHLANGKETIVEYDGAAPGSGEVKVNLDTNRMYCYSESRLDTSSNLWLEMASAPSVVKNTGIYRFTLSFEWRYSNITERPFVRVRRGNNTLKTLRLTPTSETQRHIFGYTFLAPLTQDFNAEDFRVQFKSQRNGSRLRVEEVYLTGERFDI